MLHEMCGLLFFAFAEMSFQGVPCVLQKSLHAGMEFLQAKRIAFFKFLHNR